MSAILELFHNLIDPVWLMQHGGLYFVLFIVFAETGLFAGFFLPGDSLLFITGIIIANTVAPGSAPLLNLVYWVLLITTAAIIGNYVGYWFGKKSGAMLMVRRDNWLFKKKHLIKAKEFYEDKGGLAIVLARFLPILRTFAPIVAGMVHMDKKRFSRYSILGAFCWVASIIGAGFLLGENKWVKDNLEIIIIGIVAITTLPVIIKLLTGKKPSPQKVVRY